MTNKLQQIQKGELFEKKVKAHSNRLDFDNLFYESLISEINKSIFNSQIVMLKKIAIIKNFRELISFDYANERIIPSEKSPKCVELCIALIDFWPDSRKAFFFYRSKKGNAINEIVSMSERIPIPNSNELANLDIKVLTDLNNFENKLPEVLISFKLFDSYNEWKGNLFGFISNTNSSKRTSEVLFHTYLTEAISMNFKEISKAMLVTVDQLYVQAKNRGATNAYLESLNVLRAVINLSKEQNLDK